MTVIGKLVASVRSASAFNTNAQTPPAVILWPDKERQWLPVLPQLLDALPELFVLGDYDPQQRTGPAIWLKCVVARQLADSGLAEDAIPVLYLPDISRAELRRVEDCSDAIKPLIELQYRGSIWGQLNGKDWTINAFLTAGVDGLGLDVAQDKPTKLAMATALAALLVTDVGQLEGLHLEASDFNQLLSNDPVRDLLGWLNAPDQLKSQWNARRWQALCSIARSDFGFDLEGDGPSVAAELLSRQEGKWMQVWARFCDNPASYPQVLDELKRVNPPDLFSDPDRYWSANERAESDVRASLEQLASRPQLEACEAIGELERDHGTRRDNVWAGAGESPWVVLLQPLATIAEGVKTVPDGLTPTDMAEKYESACWQIDEAVLQAFERCSTTDQERLIEKVLTTLYVPWLTAVNERFQALVQAKGYPGSDRVSEATRDYLVNGEVVFFVDGLRLDVAHQLVRLFNGQRRCVSLETHWSALPSVTATAKAAISPVHGHLIGADDETDFEPSVENAGRLSNDRFKRLLNQMNWQVLDPNDLGDPGGNAWIAFGDIDKEGHASGLKLPKRIPAMLDAIAERVDELLDCGWRKVRIVTDHGWLLVPGGLPKTDLPVQATDSRWGRCARLKQNVSVSGLTLGWHWNANVPIYYPFGIHSFIAGHRYAHGGVSLQECLVPIITIESTSVMTTTASISSVRWRGLTCRVETESDSDTIVVDIRTRVADATSSIVTPRNPKEGAASLMVADDDLEGLSATIVVLDSEGNVIAKYPTTVGSDE